MSGLISTEANYPSVTLTRGGREHWSAFLRLVKDAEADAEADAGAYADAEAEAEADGFWILDSGGGSTPRHTGAGGCWILDSGFWMLGF